MDETELYANEKMLRTVAALATAETYLDEALVLCRAAKALGRGQP